MHKIDFLDWLVISINKMLPRRKRKVSEKIAEFSKYSINRIVDRSPITSNKYWFWRFTYHNQWLLSFQFSLLFLLFLLISMLIAASAGLQQFLYSRLLILMVCRTCISIDTKYNVWNECFFAKLIPVGKNMWKLTKCTIIRFTCLLASQTLFL